MNRIPVNPFPPVLHGQGIARPAALGPSASKASFQQLMEGQLLKFSQHAETRLRQRGIVLSPDKLADIASAVEKAAAKGAKDSLILTSDVALIVNVKNKTVVTAIDQSSMKNNVFTQIDSAVVL